MFLESDVSASMVHSGKAVFVGWGFVKGWSGLAFPVGSTFSFVLFCFV